MTRKQRLAEVQKQIEARTAEIVVGRSYFLNTFGMRDGATVTVLDVSTKKNRAGYNSTVTVEVYQPVGDEVTKPRYAAGTVHTVNAVNLYDSVANTPLYIR